jgi:hypothetical protein
LAKIDFNPEVGNVGSFQMFRNEIIKDSEAAMKREMAAITADDPASMNAWNNGEDVPEITQRLTSAINRSVDMYADRLPAQSLEVIRDICIKAVE